MPARPQTRVTIIVPRQWVQFVDHVVARCRAEQSLGNPNTPLMTTTRHRVLQQALRHGLIHLGRMLALATDSEPLLPDDLGDERPWPIMLSPRNSDPGA